MALIIKIYIAKYRSKINTKEYSSIIALVGYNKSYRLIG